MMECSYCGVDFEDIPVHRNGEVYCSLECAEADLGEERFDIEDETDDEVYADLEPEFDGNIDDEY